MTKKTPPSFDKVRKMLKGHLVVIADLPAGYEVAPYEGFVKDVVKTEGGGYDVIFESGTRYNFEEIFGIANGAVVTSCRSFTRVFRPVAYEVIVRFPSKKLADEFAGQMSDGAGENFCDFSHFRQKPRTDGRKASDYEKVTDGAGRPVYFVNSVDVG